MVAAASTLRVIFVDEGPVMGYRIARRFSPRRFGLLWLRRYASLVAVTVRHGQPDDAASPCPVGTP